ncbi:glutathione S-transferase family protein [Acinetobacter modestus]|uniref:glutathione S-transferase family protein n=1 Tax=Acinetobacter modestus TaxID=1776740 RepID=UPI003015EBEF
MALKFYTNTQSRGMVVDWLLIELGVACERIEVAYQTEMKAPEYLKINPFGKVPVLVDGDIVIYELGAVCAYLTDKFADKGLAPALNDPKRGLYYRWLMFISGPWEAASTNKMLGVDIKSDQKMFVGYGDYQEAYHAFIQGLNEADPYLCGQEFTTADVMVAAMLFWQLKIGQIQTHPVIEQYLENVKQRESYQKFVAFFSEPA